MPDGIAVFDPDAVDPLPLPEDPLHIVGPVRDGDLLRAHLLGDPVDGGKLLQRRRLHCFIPLRGPGALPYVDGREGHVQTTGNHLRNVHLHVRTGARIDLRRAPVSQDIVVGVDGDGRGVNHLGVG